jgi:hypothetical protein
MQRREFLALAGATAWAAEAPGVSVVVEPDWAPARWAAGELRDALAERSLKARIVARRCDGPPETVEIGPGYVAGSDARGLVYALLELADRVRCAADPRAALHVTGASTERPANRVRGVARLFVSDVEDLPWFNDRVMWPAYLTMLAAERFNRFQLSFGIGYDFNRQVTDCYFHFAYPFLVTVPGYDVKAVNLADAERDRNLETLRFISDEAARRGLDFQLGLWCHGYEWTDSPRANYTISGLNAKSHGAYCRDALAAVLRACPSITGVTFRIHGESGVAEGNYEFWATVFDGAKRSGRRVEIDMHAKGIDERMIRTALATGLPVRVSPKFWAEHQGLPYHQAAIREQEMPKREKGGGLFALSSGARSFLRYGYGDLLAEDRQFGVLHRIWPGTQRLLVWGDPLYAAAYGRAFSFCGSDGVEIHEPLSFKGRRGSGHAGGRLAYADASLRPRWDWQKYEYGYRIWGRLLYNPDAAPDVWQRYLAKQFGPAAAQTGQALANASRILPLVTTAHGPSAANNTYWPEMYTNQPIVDAGRRHPYSDTPAPKVFGNASAFDPEMFARVNDFADELRAGRRSGKWSPLEVADTLDRYAAAASAIATARGPRSPEFRRLEEDVLIQAALGRFFAGKLRAAVYYALGQGEEALKHYRAARAAWSTMAERARGVYAADITIGERPELRGHWLDRLPAIDQDIADMAARIEKAPAAVALIPAWKPAAAHTPPPRFTRGREVPLDLRVEGAAEAMLHYRRVHQGERWVAAPMQAHQGRFTAAIPAAYTDSPFPLQYYFEVRGTGGRARIVPGFDADFLGTPYVVVRSAVTGTA